MGQMQRKQVYVYIEKGTNTQEKISASQIEEQIKEVQKCKIEWLDTCPMRIFQVEGKIDDKFDIYSSDDFSNNMGVNYNLIRRTQK